MNLLHFLDPDREWRSLDKLQHAAACFALCLLFDVALPVGAAFLVTVWTAIAYEAGQTDTAAATRRLGTPGFGFGLLDLAFAVIGAALYVGLRALLRALL